MGPEYAILIDFEATADSSDDELTRLAQCDHHEIIEFVRDSLFPELMACDCGLRPSARALFSPTN